VGTDFGKGRVLYPKIAHVAILGWVSRWKFHRYREAVPITF
jgi:hypothetical protein